MFNYKHNNFPIDALQLKKANAIDEIIVTTTTNNSKIINYADTKDNEKNMISNSFKEEIGSEKKNSNKDIINQKGVTEDDNNNNNNLILNNKTIKNASLSSSTTTPTTKSSNRIEIFNFAAAGDWACTSKTKDTVKNIIDHDAELVLALGDLSYDSGAKCWLKIIKPIAEKTKIVIGNHEAESSKKLKDYMKAFHLEKQYYSFNYKNVHFLALSTETSYDKGSKQYNFAENDLQRNKDNSSTDWIIVFYHRNAYSSGGGLPDETNFRKAY
ncbi:MAG TPA: metallophosphoesterase, partial [Nitrososphaeraceae archaeon]|nr:metallophosphoesterase [Nitrososphaeraceae archaeon]